MTDGSFYTRKSPMPVARYYDDSQERMVPASLHYEFNRKSLKKDSLQSLVFQVEQEDKAKNAKSLKAKSSKSPEVEKDEGASSGHLA